MYVNLVLFFFFFGRCRCVKHGVCLGGKTYTKYGNSADQSI